ncbi:MAG: hypothetical protein KDD43_00215 [Bdellovibrionales bacterium]|nr:hypothetical protein [Bdellovibrionales bacterium]
MIKVNIKWEEGQRPDKKTGETELEMPAQIIRKEMNIYHEGYCYWCYGFDYYTDGRGLVLRASRWKEGE